MIISQTSLDNFAVFTLLLECINYRKQLLEGLLLVIEVECVEYSLSKSVVL